MNREELIVTLRLNKFDRRYPPRKYGNGEDVIELDGPHSWKCLKQALLALSDKEFEKVISCKIKFNFHNNVSNGHYSVGASWTIAEFISNNGGRELRERQDSLI